MSVFVWEGAVVGAGLPEKWAPSQAAECRMCTKGKLWGSRPKKKSKREKQRQPQLNTGPPNWDGPSDLGREVRSLWLCVIRALPGRGRNPGGKSSPYLRQFQGRGGGWELMLSVHATPCRWGRNLHSRGCKDTSQHCHAEYLLFCRKLNSLNGLVFHPTHWYGSLPLNGQLR